jgi:TetR/AcrR family transcriptional regulator, transcriptional repressor for nem operon
LLSGADPIATARALLAAQQGLVFMGRTGLDIDQLTATARSLAVQLLPGTPDGRLDR